MNYRYAALSALPFVAGSLLFGLGGMEIGAGKDGGAGSDCSADLLRGGYGMTGTGSVAGVDLAAIQTLVFDGAGKVAGHGTAVFHNRSPSYVERFDDRDGTYSVRKDCTGTMRWFAKPHSLGPLLDYVHTADLVVSDGGKQISLIYTSEPNRSSSPERCETRPFQAPTGRRTCSARCWPPRALNCTTRGAWSCWATRFMPRAQCASPTRPARPHSPLRAPDPWAGWSKRAYIYSSVSRRDG